MDPRAFLTSLHPYLLASGATIETLKQELEAIPFRFVPADARFRAATESGEDEPGLVRMQVGGQRVADRRD